MLATVKAQVFMDRAHEQAYSLFFLVINEFVKGLAELIKETENPWHEHIEPILIFIRWRPACNPFYFSPTNGVQEKRELNQGFSNRNTTRLPVI